jgi:hypothetical protein
MKNKIKQFNTLLDKYSNLRDEEVILNSHHYDAIYYDICGYEETIVEIEGSNNSEWLDEELKHLREQVESISKLVDALNTINYRHC